MHRIYFLSITALLLLCIALALGKEIKAQDKETTPLSGEELFIKNRCVRCHTIGRGRFVGPDLSGVGTRYSRDEIKKWIENPEEVYQSKGKMPLNEGYPPMPPLGVSPEEAEIIADYLLTFKASVAPKTEGGMIKGKIVNKSTEEAVEDIQVTLTAYLGDRERETRKVKTNRDGLFEFKNLAWNQSYAISLNYKGGEYITDKLVFYPAEDTKTLDLPVYEPTDSDKDISVNANQMIVQTSEGEGAITVAELLVFHNGSKRIYIGAKEIQDGRREILRFSLPPGAINIQLLHGLTTESVVETNQGFVDTSSVGPGIKRVVYAYTLPYKSGRNILEKTIDYPTNGFVLLVSDSGVEVKVDRLTAGGAVRIADGRFLQWTGAEIPSGIKIRIEIGKSTLLAEDFLKWVAFGVLAILLGVGIIYSFVTRSKKASLPIIANSPAKEDLEEERRKLIQEIAKLDDSFEAKEIAEEEYRGMRSEKKERLIEITREIKNRGS